MTFTAPELFIIVRPRTWPLKAFSGSESVLNYGRKITNVTFSSDDDAELSFIESGTTQEIIGLPAIPGTIVLAARLNATWVILQTCFVATEKRALENATDDDEPEASTYQSDIVVDSQTITVRPDEGDHYPYTIELITTGANKADLDGLYQLYSRYNGKRQRRDHISNGRVKTDLTRRPGATLTLSFVGTYDSENDEIVKTYTLTVTHSAITTTVYEGTGAQLTKQTGDDSLPGDVWLYVNQAANMPLWFEFDQGCDLDGLYTLWPGYWENTNNTSFATSKGYYHKPDGSREALAYHMEYSTSGTVFTIDGGDFQYTCNLSGFSMENGSVMLFDLSVDNTGCDLPDTLQVRRPATSYTRTIKLQEQK